MNKRGHRIWRPYPEYKDSSVEWLELVPRHWDVCRLKRVCRLQYGDSLASDMRDPGEVAVFGSNGVVGHHSKANTSGPCIVVGRKGSFGKVNYTDQPAFAIDTTFFVDPLYTKANMRWLYSLLGSLRLDALTKDSAVPGLDREDAYRCRVPLPSKLEQSVIGSFLEHQTAKIDALIEKKQRLMELLDEKRSALITAAVTGQIDVTTGKPYAEYKDSGIEWLGLVPRHWDVCRLKRVCRLQYGDSLASDMRDPGEVAVFGSNGVVGHHSKANTSGPCIVVGRKGSFGKVNYTDQPAFAIDTTFFVDPLYTKTSMRWLYHLLGSLRLDALTKDAAVPGLDREDAYRCCVPLPGKLEQAAIATFLDHETASIDQTKVKTQESIERLQEYRSALITAAVTGQIDVRDWQRDEENREATGESTTT